ncbi:hypothetical protein M9458_025229, partial [Cirrhinus mrigala]
MDWALAEVMVSTTPRGAGHLEPLRPAGIRHVVPRGQDASATGCPFSESEESAREGLSQGPLVPGTRSEWASRTPQAGRCHFDPLSATLPRPPQDSAVEPVLKQSHMKQPQWRDRRCSCHMPQEPLKPFQWDRRPALEHIQAVQHGLGMFLHEVCHLFDQIQLSTKKRDPLCRVEFALFLVDLKAQPAEVRAPGPCVRTTNGRSRSRSEAGSECLCLKCVRDIYLRSGRGSVS